MDGHDLYIVRSFMHVVQIENKQICYWLLYKLMQH